MGENQSLQATYAEVITAHDTNKIDDNDKFGYNVFVGVGGDVSVLTISGQNSIVFKNVPSGSILPVRVARVNSTNTTATNMVALR